MRLSLDVGRPSLDMGLDEIAVDVQTMVVSRLNTAAESGSARAASARAVATRRRRRSVWRGLGY